MERTNDLRIAGIEKSVIPAELKRELPITEEGSKVVAASRRAIDAILRGDDPRMLAIVGPCSIHDVAAADEYARRLNSLRQRFRDKLYIVMRVYFEKPRTTLGWRGLMIDPHLDGSYNINEGLRMARDFLVKITDMGLPAASEMLDPIIPQFIDDLVSWSAIGARTTESQTHRNMASGLSMPLGFKNGTDGNIQIALDAIQASRSPHSFLGIDEEGRIAILKTTGNESCHLILRGGKNGPNYYEEFVEDAEELMKERNIPPAILIDCSHANSGKQQKRQIRVLRSLLEQRSRHAGSLKGFMIESNLKAGKQPLSGPLEGLEYGVSVTDECVGWEATEEMLLMAYEKINL